MVPVPNAGRAVARRCRALLLPATAVQAVVATVLLLPLPTGAQAAPAACARSYPDGTGPVIERPSLQTDARELCFRAFALWHSGVSRTPLAVSERLTRARVQQAEDVPRDDAFHAEDSLPEDEQSRLSDYARSGFDRGHMAPSGDMPSAAAQRQSFSLANIVPQAPGSNRCLWEGVESTVRALALEEDDVWVVTGPIFEGESLQRLNGRVLVPTSLFKAVWVPALNGAAAYLAPNAPGARWQAVSIEELRRITGINVFPTLPAPVRARAMALPAPKPNNIRESCFNNGNNGAVAQQQPGPTAGTGATPASTGPAATPRPGRQNTSRMTLILAAVFAAVAVVALIRVLGRR